MTNVSVLLFDLKTGRSSSTVQVRLLRFLKAMNVCRGGELMGVDMLLLDSQANYLTPPSATMMPATMNFNRLATHMPNLKSSSIYNYLLSTDLICEITVVMSTVTDPFQDKNRVMATINMENDMYVTMSFFDSQAVKMHNQQEKMRGDPRVVVATSVNPKMVGGHLFLNATSGTHIYFDKETAVGESFFYMLVAQDTGLTPASPRLRGYAKVESLSIAELNNFVTTAPSQSDWNKGGEGMLVFSGMYYYRQLIQYRVEMPVADETGEALFVCFDGVLTKLHNMRALYHLNK
ncbi:hypothetical protein HID58_003207 [Brassica napus]|uniref:Uncharacterized protein n=1 Tax=Brassica napus TaxID=3708 RepID=A0ABQ8ESJ3_BRANA|nr:hypothetical protein HID58_003207 [Brassica napus]